MAVFDKLEKFEERLGTGVCCKPCNLNFNAGTKFCTNCGGKLISVVPPPVAADPGPTKIKCQKCYHINPISTKFCSECGTDMRGCQTTGREALDLPTSHKVKYVPPDHTKQPIPVVKEDASNIYDISGMNVRGQ